MKKIILIICVSVFAASCNTYKPCHVKKYHVDRGIKRAQSKPRFN